MGRAMLDNTPANATQALRALHAPGGRYVAHIPTGTLLQRHKAYLKLVRSLGDTFTPQAKAVLIEVALQPGITMQDISDETGLSLASVSRNLMALGEAHRITNKRGLDLVETIEDPTERRRKIAFLTPKGRKLVEAMLATTSGDDVILDSPTATQFKNRTFRS